MGLLQQGETKDLQAKWLYQGETKNFPGFGNLSEVGRDGLKRADADPELSRLTIADYVLHFNNNRTVIVLECEAVAAVFDARRDRGNGASREAGA